MSSRRTKRGTIIIFGGHSSPSECDLVSSGHGSMMAHCKLYFLSKIQTSFHFQWLDTSHVFSRSVASSSNTDISIFISEMWLVYRHIDPGHGTSQNFESRATCGPVEPVIHGFSRVFADPFLSYRYGSTSGWDGGDSQPPKKTKIHLRTAEAAVKIQLVSSVFTHSSLLAVELSFSTHFIFSACPVAVMSALRFQFWRKVFRFYISALCIGQIRGVTHHLPTRWSPARSAKFHLYFFY